MKCNEIKSFLNLTEQVSWDKNDKQNKGKPFLKIWIGFDCLREFVKLIGIDFESIVECTLLESSIYLEMDDFDVYRFFDFKNVQSFIEQNGICKY